jgi:eukaryotic-like serine/threonine-protein kinase
MEFFLRNAQGLPLHDIDRERKIVRGRLEAIASGISAAGEIGVGPGHYALGRGYLALQEFGEALAHLRKAEAAGYRAAGLDYALGMALSEIYKKELADTKRMEGERKKQRIAEIEAEYKAPALRHLRAALGGTIEAPAYAEGLIALYEGRHEEALAKAREAFEKAPWLYEAKKLEGDVLFAMGSKFGHDAAFDFEKMSQRFGEAGAAYRVAAEIGSSDPAVHLSMCELSTQEMCGSYAHGSAMRPGFEVARAACEKAIAANPAGGAGHVSLAQVHAQYAWRTAASSRPEQDAEETFTTATRHAEEAAKSNTKDPMAPYVVGMVSRSRVMYASDRGLAIEPAAGRAIEAYDEALKRDPTFVWALNESCSVYYFRAQDELLRGVDVRRSFEEGLARCKRAAEVDPRFVYATVTAADHWLLLAEQKVAQGRAPSDEAREIGALIERLRQQSPRSSLVPYFQVVSALVEAAYQIESDGDPMPLLTRAEASAKEYAELEPTTSIAQKLHGKTATARARHLAARGEEPSRWVAEARDAFDRVLKLRPWDHEYRAFRADVEVIALGWSHRQGKATKAEQDATLASMLALVDAERANPRLHRAIGELRELRAAFSIEHGGDGEAEIAEGLAAIERALAMHPRMAPALACKGRLLFLRATSAKDRTDARATARSALGAFTAALGENPLLERKERQRIEAARRLAEDDAPSRD